MESTDLKSLLKIDITSQDISPEIYDYLKPIGKILFPYGFNKETKEVNFGIKMIEGISVQKLIPYIEEILLYKAPIKLGTKSKSFHVFPILDYETGFDGRYSLLISENREFTILKEHIEGNEIVKKFEDLEKALQYISKNLYYYEMSA
jgi:hypothetical protein